MTQQITAPTAPFFTDQNGKALDLGFVWVGAENQDPQQNPIALYWDESLTIAASQPLRTANGYIYRNGAPATVYHGAAVGVSMRVSDRNQRVISNVSSAGSIDGINLSGYLDSARPLQSYTALRAYTGRATTVRITTPGIAGFFRRNGSAADNGGTVIVDGSGRSWERVFDGAILASWFGAAGGPASASASIQAAIDAAHVLGSGDVVVPYSKLGYVITTGVTVKKGVRLLGEGSGSYISTGVTGQGYFARSFFVMDAVMKGSTGFTVEDGAEMNNFGFYYKTVNTQITAGPPPEFGWAVAASGFGYRLKNLSSMGASYFLNLESAERCNVSGITGLVTRVAIRMRRSRDVSRFDDIHFNPNITFTAQAGSTAEGFSAYFFDWLHLNSTLMRYGSADIHFIDRILGIAHKYGIHVVPANHQDYYDDGTTPLGTVFDDYPSSFAVDQTVIDVCKYPIYIERPLSFTAKIGNADIVPISADGNAVGVTMTGGARGALQIGNLMSKGTAGETAKHVVLNSSEPSTVDISNSRMIFPGNDNLTNDYSSMFTVTGSSSLSVGISYSKTNAVGVYRHVQYGTSPAIVPQGFQIGVHSIEQGSRTLDTHFRDGADNKVRLLSVDRNGGFLGRTVELIDDASSAFDLRSDTNVNGRALVMVSASFAGNAFVFAYAQGTTLTVINTGTDAAAGSTNPDTDAKLNVYMSSSGVIGIKNRLGSTRSVTVTFFPSV